jgi:hypothetical protein
VTKVPSLPERMLRVLSEDERRMHVAVKDERDRVLAHSDSTAWELRPQVLRLRGNEMLVPVHHDIHAPLTREGTGQFRIMCNKLMEACFEERIRLEPELMPFLKVIQPDDAELERVAAKLGVALPR